jgi:hypothetical protein
MQLSTHCGNSAAHLIELSLASRNLPIGVLILFTRNISIFSALLPASTTDIDVMNIIRLVINQHECVLQHEFDVLHTCV